MNSRLISTQCFSISNKGDAQDLRIYGFRIVDQLKHEGTPYMYEKLRQVGQGFNEKHCFLTHEPTGRRASQRLDRSLAFYDESLQVLPWGFRQTYVQSKTKLQSPVFV